jgi:hypothetical protein
MTATKMCCMTHVVGTDLTRVLACIKLPRLVDISALPLGRETRKHAAASDNTLLGTNDFLASDDSSDQILALFVFCLTWYTKVPVTELVLALQSSLQSN